MVEEYPAGVAVFVDEVQDFKHPMVARTGEAADQDVSVLSGGKVKGRLLFGVKCIKY